jgi:hypothetical protein
MEQQHGHGTWPYEVEKALTIICRVYMAELYVEPTSRRMPAITYNYLFPSSTMTLVTTGTVTNTKELRLINQCYILRFVSIFDSVRTMSILGGAIAERQRLRPPLIIDRSPPLTTLTYRALSHVTSRVGLASDRDHSSIFSTKLRREGLLVQ